MLEAVTAALGLTIVALGFGSVIGGLGGLMLWRTRRAISGAWTKRAPGDLGVVVRATALLPTFAAIAAIIERVAESGAIEGKLWAWRGAAIVATSAAASLYLSSLIDWCYVWPRLCGLGEVVHLPCQTSATARWRTLTQAWLTHRVAAYAIVRVSLIAVLAFITTGLHPHLSSTEASVVAAVAAAVLLYYLNRVITIGASVTNPPVHVGDKITLAEEFGTGVLNRPTYYVVDVDINGVRLLELEGPHDLPRNAEVARDHDRTISLDDVTRLLRTRDAFSGCQGTCCKANKYCPLERNDPLSDYPS